MLFLDSSFLPTKNNQDETYRSFFANTIHTTEVVFWLVTNNLLMPKALVWCVYKVAIMIV